MVMVMSWFLLVVSITMSTSVVTGLGERETFITSKFPAGIPLLILSN